MTAWITWVRVPQVVTVSVCSVWICHLWLFVSRTVFHTLLPVYCPSSLCFNSFFSVCCLPLVCVCMRLCVYVWVFARKRERERERERAGAGFNSSLYRFMSDWSNCCFPGNICLSICLPVCLIACLSGSSLSLLSTQMHRWPINKQWSMSPQQGFNHWRKSVCIWVFGISTASEKASKQVSSLTEGRQQELKEAQTQQADILLGFAAN